MSRAEVAIAALRQRESEHRQELGAPPRHIRHAIADFEAQITAMHARFKHLANDSGVDPDPGVGRLV